MFDISKFDQYREDNRREVKKAKGGLPVSLWETYSSFANCYGGVIILGISENSDGSWRTTGLENPTKLLKEFWDLVNNKKKVNINLLRDDDVEIYEDTGGIIIVIRVPKAKRGLKPVYINNDLFGGTYRRNWEGDYLYTKNEVLSMLRDQPEETVDMKVLDNVMLEALNRDTIKSYRNRHMAYKPGHPWEKLDDSQYMERLGAAGISKEDGKLHPTAAGLLMFGDEYLIVREFPEYFLDYREMLDPSIRWTDRLQSSSGDWTGNLFEFYFRVYNKLIKDIKVPFRLEGGNRIDDTSVHKALREALANCLINTDYFTGRGIVIRKEQDYIRMENPGDVRTGKEQMLRGGVSDPRNKALMKMFNMINIGERAGSGVPDIYAVWEDEGWMMPSVKELYGPDRTILELPLVKKGTDRKSDKKATIKSDDKKATIKSDDKKVTEKTLKQYDLILNFMQPEEIYKSSEFCKILNLKETRTKQILNELLNLEKIEAVGKNKNKRYKLK